MNKRIEVCDGLWVCDFRDSGKTWKYTIEIDPKYGTVRYMGFEELRRLYEAVDRLLWDRVNDTCEGYAVG